MISEDPKEGVFVSWVGGQGLEGDGHPQCESGTVERSWGRSKRRPAKGRCELQWHCACRP